MSGSLEVQRLARMWIEKAEEDLHVAQRLLDPPEVCPFSTVCFHAQQSVEKYIKAILVARSIPFPKAHDIGELLHLLPASVSVPLSVEEQELLTFYATTGRYRRYGQRSSQPHRYQAAVRTKTCGHSRRLHEQGSWAFASPGSDTSRS